MLRYPDRCSIGNAAADRGRCQVASGEPALEFLCLALPAIVNWFSSAARWGGSASNPTPGAASGLGQAILAQVRIMRHSPIIHEPPRHRGKYPALFVSIIGRHPRMGPYHLFMLGIDLANIPVMDILANVDSGYALLDHADKTRRDVT